MRLLPIGVLLKYWHCLHLLWYVLHLGMLFQNRERAFRFRRLSESCGWNFANPWWLSNRSSLKCLLCLHSIQWHLPRWVLNHQSLPKGYSLRSSLDCQYALWWDSWIGCLHGLRESVSTTSRLWEPVCQWQTLRVEGCRKGIRCALRNQLQDAGWCNFHFLVVLSGLW